MYRERETCIYNIHIYVYIFINFFITCLIIFNMVMKCGFVSNFFHMKLVTIRKINVYNMRREHYITGIIIKNA